jgi:hypothetical protein
MSGETKSPGIVFVQDGRSLTLIQSIFERGGFTTTTQVDSMILITDAASDEMDNLEELSASSFFNINLTFEEILITPVTRSGRSKIGDVPRSENLSLYGVEIAGLKTVEAANQAWEASLANCWISFTDSFSGKQLKTLVIKYARLGGLPTPVLTTVRER